MSDVPDTAGDLDTIGLSADASLEDVHRVWRRLALEHHPDRGGDKEAFQTIKAAVDRLTAGLPGTSRVTEHLAFGGEVVSDAIKCADNVRCMLLLSGLSLWTLDEKQALVTQSCRKWVALRAVGEAFLCCCLIGDDEQHVAVGSSRGNVYIVSVLGESQPRPAPIAAGDGPVLAITCLSECSLLASVAGRITLIDCVLECALRSVEALPSPLDGAMAEVLCQVPASQQDVSSVLQCEESSTCTTAVCVCIGGSDASGAGLLLSLRINLDALLDENQVVAADALHLGWRAVHDEPVYAVSAAAPSFVLAATGHMCMLHASETGIVLRRLAAGSGVLYALALNPGGDCLLAAGSEEVVHAFNFPSGTKRAQLHLPRGSARDCSMNSATINALAFVDDRAFLSGGYDAAVTTWQLTPPPRSPAVRDRSDLQLQDQGCVCVRSVPAA